MLCQEIDWAHEEEQQAVFQEQIRNAQQLQEELKFVNEDMEVIPATSSGRMSLVDAPATVDKETQVNILAPPPIRKCRNATYEIKDTIATLSCKAAITAEKARITTKVVCEKFYGHQYYLEPPHDLSSDGARSKKPRSSDDYQIYEKVLPSSKSINNFKHKKAFIHEIEAANALINKKPTTNVALHFDTTTRSRREGDRPCLILNFCSHDPNECKMISLRPLFFAFEDRDQIMSLIVETLNRLTLK